MKLLFDIGNTNIVLGIVENNNVIATYRYVTNPSLTVDDYYQKINISITEHQEPIEGAIISSVVPQLDLVFVQLLEKYYNIKPLLVGPGLKSGLQIKIESPKQLGADLLCDAVGTYNKYGGPSIIVDMGTATKILVVTKNKEFIGGVICAGINASMESLINSTSKLSRTTLSIPEKIVNSETSQCIQSGIIHGHIAMVDGLIDKIKEELEVPNATVVLTGGYSNIIYQHLRNQCILDSNLLLDGLNSIYERNKK